MPPEGDFQPYQSSTPLAGIITQWMDEKGYGWVESGGKQFFVHIKDFDRGQRRPKAGEELRFIPGLDPKGRPCAKQVTFVKSGNFQASVGAWILLCLLLVLPLVALQKLPLPWWAGAGGLLVVSAITYFMYADDKRRALAKGWRVSEGSLHMAELLGGWPGAFLAQRTLRHKCSKMGYQVVFWSIVILHQLAALAVLFDHHLIRALLGF